MEMWPIVVLVVGTNVGTALLALLGTRKQLKHSEKRLGKQLEAQREADHHNRRWAVRSQPLLKLRVEIARMAEKLESSIGLATQVTDKVTPESDKIFEALGKAVKEWDAYIESGEFYQTLHMQYDHKLKVEAQKVFVDYQSAYMSIGAFQQSKMKGEVIRAAKDVIRRNAVTVSAVQSRINEMLEEL